MLPDKALKALQSRPDLSLLIDRRTFRPEECLGTKLVIEAVVGLPGGIANAYLIRGTCPQPLPARLTMGAMADYTRLMDRFYVPISPNAAVVSAFFDLIADLYDELIGYSVNLETAQHLLSSVLETAPPSPRILDFGCGTGVAREALSELGSDAEIIGTDISTEMLRHAADRGETVLTIDQWRAETLSYDGAIACFVLHYGVPDLDLVRIASSLAPGGRFAANFFKAGGSDIRRLTQLMSDAGLALVRHAPIPSSTVSENLALVFERPTC